MPNWVYNHIDINGTPGDIEAFITKAAKPYKTYYKPWNEQEPKEQLIEEFSFWNFIAPDQDNLELYFETSGSKPDPTSPTGYIRTGDTPYNWYNWNINNWGTKWDACEVSQERLTDTNLSIRFDTAWDKPDPIFMAMTEQHPELTFDFSWEEEQGWGGEAQGYEGEYSVRNEWDIPNSHEDYVALGREDSCNCATTGDLDYWYSDCPPLTEEERERIG
jgi:hypothetical protein